MYQVIKTTDSPELLLFFVGIYLLLGLVFFIVGIGIGHHYRKQRRKDLITISATVTRIEQKTMSTSRHGDYSSIPSVSYFPVFQYDYAGYMQEAVSNFGQNQEVYHIGQNVDIYIDPETGKFYSCPNDDKAKKLISRIFTILGCVMLSLAIIFGFVYIAENNVPIHF